MRLNLQEGRFSSLLTVAFEMGREGRTDAEFYNWTYEQLKETRRLQREREALALGIIIPKRRKPHADADN